MAPSCFALQVPDVRRLQVPVGMRTTDCAGLSRAIALSQIHAHAIDFVHSYFHFSPEAPLTTPGSRFKSMQEGVGADRCW